MTSTLSSCTVTESKQTEPSLRQMLAQKLMIDIRYFCAPESLKRYKGRVSCSQKVTKLPQELAKIITSSDLGGVILFAENFATIDQSTQLIHDLQEAAKQSELSAPLFISVDQEGGRVARLPRTWSTPMSGNMAIGATYHKHGDKFARESGKVLGAELAALGINVNHGPTVDVNVNAKNPVINIRSFGESADLVANLGVAQAKAIQQQGVVATLKHFPGHGDTHVDSHTGLPRVNHSIEQVQSVDLLPFQSAIDAGIAEMIMTAHIQYPQLDSSTFVSTDGKTMVKPATMSKVILTDLLRTKMGFQGVVITDALDMAGISEFFSEYQAVVETFKAGADIALMPLKIRSIEDIDAIDKLLDELESAVIKGQLTRGEITASYNRIRSLKTKFDLNDALQASLESKIVSANKRLATEDSKRIEKSLAQASLTLLKGNGKLGDEIQSLHLVLPDATKCSALASALNKLRPSLKVTCTNSFTEKLDTHKKFIDTADAVLVANITPKQSAVEMGGMEDLHKFKQSTSSKWAQDKLLEQLLQYAQTKQKQRWFVALRTPYEIERYGALSQHVIATYGYNAHVERDGDKQVAVGPVYEALASLLTSKITAEGLSPVSISN